MSNGQYKMQIQFQVLCAYQETDMSVAGNSEQDPGTRGRCNG